MFVFGPFSDFGRITSSRDFLENDTFPTDFDVRFVFSTQKYVEKTYFCVEEKKRHFSL